MTWSGRSKYISGASTPPSELPAMAHFPIPTASMNRTRWCAMNSGAPLAPGSAKSVKPWPRISGAYTAKRSAKGSITRAQPSALMP